MEELIMKTGIQLIEQERERQELEEGWTAEHDDQHTDQELARAAACYANPFNRLISRFGVRLRISRDIWWPFADGWWKPETTGQEDTTTEEYRQKRIRELQKAGALIAAELDRLQRLKE